jgi:hypothetical protein
MLNTPLTINYLARSNQTITASNKHRVTMMRAKVAFSSRISLKRRMDVIPTDQGHLGGGLPPASSIVDAECPPPVSFVQCACLHCEGDESKLPLVPLFRCELASCGALLWRHFDQMLG